MKGGWELFAALGIDPGKVGCQYFETSQYMFYQRQIDPSAYLVLWQVGVAGDKSGTTTPPFFSQMDD